MKELCSEKLIHGHEILASGYGNLASTRMYPILLGDHVIYQQKHWIGNGTTVFREVARILHISAVLKKLIFLDVISLFHF